MNIWQAIVLGLIQGFTEFLPVSSSGHLVLMQRFFDIDPEYSMFLTVMLHIGTLVPVFIVFFKDIVGLFKPPFKMMGFLALASVPAALVGLLLGDWLDSVFYGGQYLIPCFLVTAFVLVSAEYVSKKRPLYNDINIKNSALMGLAQAVAVVPGISRSGSTIAMGCFSGVDREKNANFAFLMSIPVILGSAFVESVGVIKAGSIGGIGVWPLLFGILAAAVSGYIAIKVMLRLIKKANFKWFSLYLVLLSIVMLILEFV